MSGGGACGDDQTASVSVHNATTRDRHVQPKRELTTLTHTVQSDADHE